MINFTGTSTDGRTFLSVGLSHENLRRLKADQPIRIDLTKLGIVVPPHEVVIFAGETEAIMTDRLYAHGAIGPDTITHGVEGEGGD